MKSDRLRMWRFTAAPKALRSLHRSEDEPEWLVLVPQTLVGTDLDEAIVKGAKIGQVARYDTPKGDVVYVGTSQLGRLPKSSAKGSRTAAMAASHARRE